MWGANTDAPVGLNQVQRMHFCAIILHWGAGSSEQSINTQNGMGVSMGSQETHIRHRNHQGWIQNFKKGVPILGGGCMPNILITFSEELMKLKKFGPWGGACQDYPP